MTSPISAAGINQNVPGHTHIRAGRKVVSIPDDEMVGQPLMVSYGGGVDSTAMLVMLYNDGIRPDAILFADVGGEKPETYDYIYNVMNPWLKRVGFPIIVTVKKTSKLYSTLEENCIANETLPSLAFGFKSCSLKWKVAPMDQWTNDFAPAQRAWARGMKVVKAIGYDASPADTKRFSASSTDPKYDYIYPLREQGITRPAAKVIIEAAGLPVPMKSSCFFCPAMKMAEVSWLSDNHPELLERAIKMERMAKNGKHGLKTTKGLGRNWAWRDYLDANHADVLATMDEEIPTCRMEADEFVGYGNTVTDQDLAFTV